MNSNKENLLNSLLLDNKFPSKNEELNEQPTIQEIAPPTVHELKEKKEIEIEAYFDSVRAAKKVVGSVTGANVPMLSFTAFGPVTTGMLPSPDGVPKNFILKQKALMAFQEPPRPGHRGNLKGEGDYALYCQELRDNKPEWDTFFTHPENGEHLEQSCAMLGTLATILRQRGEELVMCELVLSVEEGLLEKLGELVGEAHDQMTVFNFESLRHKHGNIKYNLMLELGKYEVCCELWKKQVHHEIKWKLKFEEQNHAFMMQAIWGKKGERAERLS